MGYSHAATVKENSYDPSRRLLEHYALSAVVHGGLIHEIRKKVPVDHQ